MPRDLSHHLHKFQATLIFGLFPRLHGFQHLDLLGCFAAPPKFLHHVHADSLNMDTANMHANRFEYFMTMPGNGVRGGGAQGDSSITKILNRIMDCIAYAAVELDYGRTLTFKTLIRAFDDFDIFESYINKEVLGKRTGSQGTLKQAITHLKHGVAFCKWMEWGKYSTAEYDELVKKLENLRPASRKGAPLEAAGNKKHKPSDVPLEEATHKTNEFCNQVLSEWNAYLSEWNAGTLLQNAKSIEEHATLLHAATMFKLTFDRGGRSIDLSRATIAFHGEALDSVQPKYAEEGASVIVLRRNGASTMQIWTKGHYMELNGADGFTREALALLEALFFECATWVGDGYALFTPTAHGSHASKAKEQNYFVDSGKFADYFLIQSTRYLGLQMRPNRARALHATHLNRQGASLALMESHAARVGGSVENMKTNYNMQSNDEVGHKSATLAKYQFDARFDGSKNTFAVLAIGTSTPREVKLARLIRRDAAGTMLCALFEQAAGATTVHLTEEFVSLPANEGFPRQKVTLGPDGQQVWRSQAASIKHAALELAKHSLDSDGMILDSMVTGKVEPTIGDMVHVGPPLHSFGEVIAIEGSNLKVAPAGQVCESVATSSRGFYQFKFGVAPVLVARDECTFPIDLTFHGASEMDKAFECTFELRKASCMETI